MIEFTKSYKTADGQVFGTIEEAQIHEIEELLNQVITGMGNDACAKMNLDEWAKLIVGNKSILIDILTTTPNSKPKARAIHGGTKKRHKTVITDAATHATNIPLGDGSPNV